MAYKQCGYLVTWTQDGKKVNVKLGMKIKYLNENWIITGWDYTKNMVYIAQGPNTKSNSPTEFNMDWTFQ